MWLDQAGAANGTQDQDNESSATAPRRASARRFGAELRDVGMERFMRA